MLIIVISDTTQGLQPALEAIFAPQGGIETVIPKCGGAVYIKPKLG